MGSAPPPTPINKQKLNSGTVQGPMIKKEKRQSSSRFNITRIRELEVLPLIKGRIIYIKINFSIYHSFQINNKYVKWENNF